MAENIQNPKLPSCSFLTALLQPESDRELLAELDFHSYEKAMPAKRVMPPCGVVSVCVQVLHPISWLSAWDDSQAKGAFPGRS